MDPVVGIGRGAYIDQARTSGICVACSGSSTSAVVNGNLADFATIDLGVSAAGGYRVSVRDSLQYYPAGNEAGFVIRYRDSGLLGLLDATLLNQVAIRTYRNGTLVETANFSSGSGLLKANVLGGSGSGKQALSFVTTQDFDEIELVYNGLVSAGKLLDVYYAFEGPGTCPKDCMDALLTAGNGATATSGQVGATVTVGPIQVNACTLGGSISGVPNVLDSDSTTNFATIASTVGLLCSRYIEVGTATTYPAGYEAGFVIDNGGSLLDLTALGGITVTTYYNGAQRESFTGSNLVFANVLGGSNKTQLGFKAGQAFNSIRISLTGVSVAVNLRVYHAYVKADTDNDGVADCLDKCTGNDLLDADGDGIPDACDSNVADLSVTKSSNSSTATVGSNVTYTVNVQRLSGPNATGVVVLDTLAPGLVYVSHVATPGTVYNPTTGRWTIGSALAGSTSTVSLSITARVDVRGVSTNIAEVIRSFETDPNSTPGNGNLSENDIASACVSVPIDLCQGSSVVLSAPDSYTAGVEWFRTFNGVTTSVATTPTFSASLSGSYSFTSVGASGCASGNCCPVILNVEPLPTPTLAASQSVICAGASTTLSVVSPVGSTTYVWSDGTVGTSVVVSPSVTTVYSVSATSAGGCSSVVSITVTVNAAPVQAPIIAICGPASSGTYSFVISPTTSGTSTSYFVKVGSAAETGPFAYGTPRQIDGNTGSFSVVIRDATTSCSITLPVTAPTNCPTCPPKVCVPIRIARVE
ncbi:hypothetical protein ACAW74_24770 [Fibrella sp. WM1]|uniref:hypothetical protein n=1 Tax=Fibrella musci TaxID=3242485 RepID=UPI0035229996